MITLLQTIIDIIHKVATAHITAASHTLQHNMDSSIEDLAFMLEKTSIPRPQALGKLIS